MKRCCLRILAGICLFLVPNTLFSQSNCEIRVFSTSNGLPQRNISNIIQDQKGFIWFASWNGLGKYDGYTFKQYRTYHGDNNQLTNNRFHLFNVDSNNDIWCRAYDSRVYRFDTKTESFIDPLLELEKKNKATYPVKKVYTLERGATWLVHNNGAFRVEKVDEQDVLTYYSPAFNNLPGINVLNVQQDSAGDEWVFTDKGLRVVGSKKILSSTPYKELCETSRFVFLISDRVLAGYDKKQRKLQRIPIPFEYKTLSSIQDLGNGNLVIGKDKGLFLYSQNDRKFRQISLNSLHDSNPYPTLIYKDRKGELWLFSQQNGVIHYDLKTGTERLLQTPAEDTPQSEKKTRPFIFEDQQGTLWMAPVNGCFSYYDRKNKKLRLHYLDPYHQNTKYNPLVLSSLYDGNNNFWFSDNRHMNKVSFIPDATHLQVTDEGFETRSFLIDHSRRFWVAGKKGYVRIFNPDKTLMGYLSPNGTISKNPVSFNHKVYCFLQDESGTIWMGTKEGGLFQLTENGSNSFNINYFVNNVDDPYSLSDNNIYSICLDSKKRIWIGTHGGGLNLLQKTPQGEIRFLNSSNQLKYPQKKFLKIRFIKEVNQVLLVATTNGLISFSSEFTRPEEVVFFQNTSKTDDISSLAGNDVMHILQDSRGAIYVSTFSGGIHKVLSDKLLSNTIQFRCFNEANGLPSDLVLSMSEDPKGNLWVVAENSFSRFNPENGTFENFDKKYFKREINFSEAIPVFWQGKLMLGTDDGFYEVNTGLLKKSSYKPSIYFTELSIQGQKQNVAIDQMKQLVLRPDERNFTIEFAALDYIDPTAIQYAYRIQGLEDKWNEIGTNREARFINLPHGNYELEVRSTNSDGVWMDNTRVLLVRVVPTFWETGWAIVLYVLFTLLITAVAVYVFSIIYRLRHNINAEKQLTDIKLGFFTDISHELRTPLTLISSPLSEVLEHEKLSENARKHLEIVHHNTDRMLLLVNQILDFRKIENGKMKLLLEKTELIGAIRDIRNDFSIMAEKKQIAFELQHEASELYAWVDRDKFQKIVLNLVSNAFKYTPNGKSITLRVEAKNDRFYVSVKDEGIGMDTQKLPTLFKRFETLVQDNILKPSSGIGLSLVKELVDLHLGNIEVTSVPGSGTVFVVDLPLTVAAYEGIDYKELILADSKEATTELMVPTDTQPAKGPDAWLEPDLPGAQDASEGEPLSLLVVEDNAELRTFLKDILSADYRVLEAVNGQEGLELALRFAPDFILSDVSMPVMDGLDMVKAIKENRNVCHIPIVLLSAKSSLDDRIAGLEYGIDDYITKPFSSTYLKTRIRLMLQQRRQLQKLYLEQSSEENKLEPCILSLDQEFMESIKTFIEKNMDNSELVIDDFARELNMGRTIFYQKMKNITGLSPIDFVLTMRIKHASVLMKTGKYNVSEIAYMSGFNDPKYFGKCFRKHTGMSPSEYAKHMRQGS